MKSTKQPEKSNTAPHRSAYDDFLHSAEWDDFERSGDSTPRRREPQRRREERQTVPARTKRTSSQKSDNRRGSSEKPRQSRENHRTAEVPRQQLSDEYLQMKAQKEHAKKRQQAKSTVLANIVAAFIITLLIAALSLVTLIGKVESYSENENRYLAGKPEFSSASVANGKFMGDMESYLSDQFAGRSALVKARTAIDVLCGKKEINGVYICDDHYLIEKPAAYDENTVNATVKAIQSFTKKHPKIHSYMAIAPDASCILTDYLPKNAPTEDRERQLKKVYKSLGKQLTTIDVIGTLKNQDQKGSLYYRTDHHWTTRAAELAFKQIAANMKIDTSEVAHKTYAVTDSFQGTLASSSGLFNAKDNIYITVPQTDVKYFVTYVNENKKKSSVFDTEKLKQKNQYEVFFGGNFAQVKIDTTLNSKKVLMVVKDSYANCLLPMLIPYYKSIVIIDPRYYTDKIEQTVKDNGVTDILWLYNTNTFFTDTSIANTFR